MIAARGWPEDLCNLPGVGRYTAGALAAQADGADVPAVEVNIRRIAERVRGRRRCATRGPLPGETRSHQPRFEGSFRQRRGAVMARLRGADAAPVAELDAEALASLVADGLAATEREWARLP